MPEQTDIFAQALFNKPSLHDCSMEQVEYLARQYPYFSIAQLLLLKKTAPDPEAYKQNTQRAALCFSHPLQLEYLVKSDSFQPEVFQKPIPETDPEVTVEAIAAPEEVATGPDNTSKAANEPSEIENTDPVPSITNEPAFIQPEDKVPEAPAETFPLAFEPYHTVDYFASQGIKLSQQEAGNDALGQRLKSFTEWLKTMKRLPETATAKAGDAVGERKVEHLAAHSLHKADVVTESMAEVWLKQGNKEKAAGVYEKLRLRHPAKSAYFAAKIETLKNS